MPRYDLQLINGDCLDVLPTIPDQSVDLTVTSPPYDNLRTYNNSLNDWTPAKWRAIIAELYRVTKVGGVVVWVVADATIDGSETGTSFKQALWAIECGFRLHDTMMWQKTASYAFDSRQKRYKSAFEFMFVWSRGAPTTGNLIKDVPNKNAGKIPSATSTKGRTKGGTLRFQRPVAIGDYQARSNIWRIVASTADLYAKQHPAPFPETLVSDHILSWSNEGDTVLDPFLGSGTTGKMAQQLGRDFIGIERDEKYFEIAKQRVTGTAS